MDFFIPFIHKIETDDDYQPLSLTIELPEPLIAEEAVVEEDEPRVMIIEIL